MRAQLDIKFRLLGRFAVTIDGEPPTQLRISSRKGSALLAYLALQPEHTANREELATLLWGDRPDQQARSSLRQCILTLRAALAPASRDLIIIEGDAVGLRTDRLSVDVLDFNELAQSTGIEDIERAASLYRGNFLSGLRIEVEGFENWIRTNRTRLEATAARVFETWADHLDNAGHGQQAIGAADRLVALDPLREDWQRRMLRIYARHRGSAAALTQANALMRLLKSELDVEPEPATSALIREIQRGAIPSAEPTTTDPPAMLFHAGSCNDIVDALTPLRHNMEQPPLAPDSSAAATTTIARGWRTYIPSFSRSTARMSRIALLLLLLAGFGFFAKSHLITAGPVNQARVGAETSPMLTVNAPSGVPGLAPVVVLPFESLTGNESDAIADLISDDLIDILSRVPNLRVISRLTSRQFRGRSKEVAAIRNELGVRYLVHGGVRTDGDKLHVNVELIDIASKMQMWSDQFEGDRRDRTASTEEIVKELGRALQVEVIKFEGKGVSNIASKQPEIDKLLAAGWAAIMGSTSSDTLSKAEVAFNEALRRDPDRISAMLGLAAHHLVAVSEQLTTQRDSYLAEAERLLERILERRPELSAAYFYRGMLQNLRGELRPALESFERSVALNPSFAPGYAKIGHILIRFGRIDEALDHIRYAIRLSPKDPSLWWWALYAGWAEIERGQYEGAFEWLFRAVALSPRSPSVHVSLAALYALVGDSSNADRYAMKYRELTPGLSNEQRLAFFSHLEPQSRLTIGIHLALASSP